MIAPFTTEELRAWYECEGPHHNNDDPMLTRVRQHEREVRQMTDKTTSEQALRNGCETYWEPDTRHVSKIKRGSGLELDYVDHATVTRMLIDIDPFWTWQPMAYTDAGSPLVDCDENGNPRALWIMLTLHGRCIPAVGTIERPGSKNYGDALKELIGDAIRNGAMRFGVCGGLWARGKWDEPQTTKAKESKPKHPLEFELSNLTADEKTELKNILGLEGLPKMEVVVKALIDAGCDYKTQTVKGWISENKKDKS